MHLLSYCQTIYCLISSSRYFIAVALGCCKIIRLFTTPELRANIANSACCRDTGTVVVYTVTKSRVTEDTGLNCFKSYVAEGQRVFLWIQSHLHSDDYLKSIFASFSLKSLLMEKNLICISRILHSLTLVQRNPRFITGCYRSQRRCCCTVVVNPR